MPEQSLAPPDQQHTRDVGDVLLRARAHLAAGHWCKRALKRGDDRCAIGAIHLAAPLAVEDRLLRNEAERAVEQHLSDRWKKRPTGGELEPIAAFNDHADTTLADVIALFDKALAELGRFHDIPVNPAQVVCP